MFETTIEVDTADGRADARLFVPEGTGPWPLVVFYADAGGLRPTMSQMAARLARAGYAVLQPNPFWRAGPFAPFDPRTVFSDPPERQRLMALVAGVRPDAVIADTKALVASIEHDARIDASRVGALGYCMGGRLAFLAAAAWPERIVAAAPIHAGGLVTDAPDSPHRLAHRIRAALYLGVADEDAGCSPEHQRALRAALDDAQVRYALELHHGAKHGFAVPDFPVYDEAASERHWERVAALFREHLPGPGPGSLLPSPAA